MLVSSFFSSKIITKQKKIYSFCRASKWQFPLALTELPLVNTSGRVQFSSPASGKIHQNEKDSTCMLLPNEFVSSFRYELSYYTLILCVHEQLRLRLYY